MFKRKYTVPLETRDSSYTDTLVNLIVTQAGGSVATATATAALESVAGLVGRAFASARVVAPDLVAKAVCPRTRQMIGRALVRQGEAMFAIDVVGISGLRLVPAADWDVVGSYSPDSWRYSLNLAGPSRQTTRADQTPDRVAHFVWQTEPDRPWRGVSPIEAAAMAGRLSAELTNALADEASGTRGHLLPIPVDGQDPTVDALKSDLRMLRGQVAVVESQQTGNWSQETGRSPAGGGWEPHRLGANPPDPLVLLFEAASREILAACGLSPSLFGLSRGDASQVREAWRLALHSVFEPLGVLAAEELATKLGVEVSFDWTALRASDLIGRARAFQSMIPTGDGLDVARASEVAGLT